RCHPPPPPPPPKPHTGGGGGGGVAPLARSTPTLPTRAQRAVGKDTPKNIKTQSIKNGVGKLDCYPMSIILR
ncbi:MAG: hypothetical protein RML94_13355, partial [Bacteroidia bacterium]|nr:hypothetical protein [Bacteroidia bacterium]